jgi:hypothetical protein
MTDGSISARNEGWTMSNAEGEKSVPVSHFGTICEGSHRHIVEAPSEWKKWCCACRDLGMSSLKMREQCDRTPKSQKLVIANITGIHC